MTVEEIQEVILENRKERINIATSELITPLRARITKTPLAKRKGLQKTLRNYEARAKNALKHQTPVHIVHHEFLNYQNVPECLKILERMLKLCYEATANEDETVSMKRKPLDVEQVNVETGTVVLSGDILFSGSKEEQKEKWRQTLRVIEKRMKEKERDEDDEDDENDEEDQYTSDEEGDCLSEVKVNWKKERNEVKRIRQRRASMKNPCPEKASTKYQRMTLKILYIGGIQGRVLWRTPFSREERVNMVNELRMKYNSFVSPIVKQQLCEVMSEKTARQSIKDALGVGLSLAEGIAYIEHISTHFISTMTSRH